MMKIKLGNNFAVFILFFGLALIEALQSRHWLEAGIFFVLGLTFLFADASGPDNKKQ